jgi:multiple antibiotic resistance protein
MDINLDLEFFILCFSSLFALINPIGNVPIFITLTENYNQKERNKIALKAIIFSFFVLIMFAQIGDLIFSFYGITIHAFRIAGGILLFKISLDMVESKRSRTKTTPSEMEEAEEKNEVAYTPIGIPLIAGPGSIASIMILSSEAKNFLDKTTLFATLAIVLIITYIIFKLSKLLSNYFGKSGLRIMQRIMGLILLVISIEFILKGIHDTIITWGFNA